MPEEKKNPNIIYCRSDKPSAFKVDLKKMMEEKERRSREDQKELKFKGRFKNTFDDNYNDNYSSPDDYGSIFDDIEKKERSIFSKIALAMLDFCLNMFDLVLSFFRKIASSLLFFLKFVFYLFLRVLSPLFFIFHWGKRSFFPRADYEELAIRFKEEALDPRTVIGSQIHEAETKKESPVPFEVDHENIYFKKSNQEELGTDQEKHNSTNHVDATEQNIYTVNSPSSRVELRIADLLPDFRLSFLRSALYLSLVMILVAAPFKLMSYYGSVRELGGRVLGVSEEALGNLKQAGGAVKEMDFYEAGDRFARASDNFIEAQEEIRHIATQLKVLSAVVPSEKLGLAADADKVLEAGEVSSEIGSQIAGIFEAFNSQEEKSIRNVFNSFNEFAAPIQANTARLHELLVSIDSDNIPEENREDFELLRSKAEQINYSFMEMVDLLKYIEVMIGFEQDKRYLLVFQNNSEMRASGGFMGSYAIVDFRDGEIINIEAPTGGTYDTEGAFYDNIIAPEPLHIVNPSWHFWDANWWPDWKKTATKLKWFYEHSGGSSVDGVIAITPTVVERVLEIVGELDMQETHGVVINAENFWEITQTFAEQKPKDHPAFSPLPYQVTEEVENASSTDPGREPKKIIGDLITVIKDEVPKRLDKAKFLDMLNMVESVLAEKQVLFYFEDWRLQNKFEELGFAGRMRSTAWDYLMVVDTNISGGKSDRAIEENIDLVSELGEDGSITNTLTITRKHNGSKGEDFVGVRNLDWMRIYVPLGSEFISAKGFWPPDDSLFEDPDPSWRHDPDLANEENFIRDKESWTKIYVEDEKTVFANWAQVDPGNSVVIELKYKLPFGLSFDLDQEQAHALLVEKQPGALNTRFEAELLLRDGLETTWSYPSDLEADNRGWSIQTDLDSDRYWAIKIK